MADEYDLAVIGAGPAGMAGAVAAAEAGLRVALLDGGRQLGGQFYRHPPESLGARYAERLHHGWSAFTALADRLNSLPGVDVLFEQQVWTVEPGFRVRSTSGLVVSAPAVLLATGSFERVVPIPGWDLPGVFTAGGAQALLKGNLVLAGKRMVVAGTGPLLLPVAAGLAAAGADVTGLYEANGVLGYARHPVPLLANPAKLVEGAEYAAKLTLGRVRARAGYSVVAIEGTDHVEGVVVAKTDGSGAEQRVACDAVAIGYGLAPQIDIGLTLGCEHQILADGTVALKVDGDQRTSVPGFSAAGETAGVAGAQTALVEGRIAGLAIARERADSDRRATSAAARAGSSSRELTTLTRRRDRQRAFADLVRAQHPIPALWRERLTPETVVCRCEEVPAAAITEALADLGAADARTVKLLTRAGMGWCQGRMCGYAVACLAAGGKAASPQDLLAAAKRPLARPVPLAVLAAANEPDHSVTSASPIEGT